MVVEYIQGTRRSMASIVQWTIQKRGDLLMRTWNFQEHWRKSMWKLQGSIKKEVEFPRMIKKKPCPSCGWNFHEFWFLTMEFPRSAGVSLWQFCRTSIQRWKSGISSIPHPLPVCLGYFWNKKNCMHVGLDPWSSRVTQFCRISKGESFLSPKLLRLATVKRGNFDRFWRFLESFENMLHHTSPSYWM